MYLKYSNGKTILPAFEGHRPRNYLSCYFCCCWIFHLIYALSTSTTVLPLFFIRFWVATKPPDNFINYSPSSDGSQCNCKTSAGGACIATCAASIDSYNIALTNGTSYTYSYCKNSQTKLLGCGYAPSSLTSKDSYREMYPSSTYCYCSDNYGARCYSICGLL